MKHGFILGLEEDNFKAEQHEREKYSDEYNDAHYGHGYAANFINIPGHEEKAAAIRKYQKEQELIVYQQLGGY